MTRAEWKVTSVVKEHQLGNPEERLRKRMERLLPQSTETAAEEERGEEPAKQREELLKKTSASSQSDSTVPQKGKELPIIVTETDGLLYNIRLCMMHEP